MPPIPDPVRQLAGLLNRWSVSLFAGTLPDDLSDRVAFDALARRARAAARRCPPDGLQAVIAAVEVAEDLRGQIDDLVFAVRNGKPLPAGFGGERARLYRRVEAAVAKLNLLAETIEDATPAVVEAAQAEVPKKPTRTRRRKAPKDPPKLTPKQTEALMLVAQHKGNVTAAATMAGKSRQAMQRQYDAALKKLGPTAARQYTKTQGLPTGARGESLVEEEE